ncbi:hypothetical protein Scep_010228 [Stephania cephalantha]|uniref:Uncharacterized protein n=1 Tax=Stephania cephalantha TaxID=152367 RepID=A0AAP0JUQ3_9MAGN
MRLTYILPSHSIIYFNNSIIYALVEETGHPVRIVDVKSEIPADFPVGVYIRNGPNPLFGGLKSTTSIFGHTSNTWIEGEGMLHALYFTKDDQQQWIISYNNEYVEIETFKLEKKRNKSCFLPAIEGDSPAVLATLLFNKERALRFSSLYAGLQKRKCMVQKECTKMEHRPKNAQKEVSIIK